jgi:hypothetical protein
MKTSHIFAITLVFIMLVFVFASASFSQPQASAKNLGAASGQQFATSTPIGDDHSEVGSTDGIVIMGFVLVAIVTLPVVFHGRRKKNK